jgi:hypothetical protein
MEWVMEILSLSFWFPVFFAFATFSLFFGSLALVAVASESA